MLPAVATAHSVASVKCGICLPFLISYFTSLPPIPTLSLPSSPLPTHPLPISHFQCIYILLEEWVLGCGALSVVCIGQHHLKRLPCLLVAMALPVVSCQ